jgi:hypothetical protein
MRVRLKGVNSKRKRLADGSFKTYYWLGKGGPPLRGEPGSAEFEASYNEAARKVTPPSDKLLSFPPAGPTTAHETGANAAPEADVSCKRIAGFPAER